MKSSPNAVGNRLVQVCEIAAFVAVAGWMICASGALPSWTRNLEAGSPIEAALFRAMSLPGGEVQFRRPPSETTPALSELIKSQPTNVELYSLRALEEEQQLDFTAAESDWKTYAETATTKAAAQLALAGFYRRRLRPLDEIKALAIVANAPAPPSEELTAPRQQQSWQAFERIFSIIQDQGLGKDLSIAQYRAWLVRYPQERSLYPRFLDFLISQKDYAAAGQLAADYSRKFPDDEIFPVKAKAIVEYRQGSIQQGLSVYERSFQPLWAPELVKSYFDLLTQTQSLRKFLDQARAALAANPEDLNAMARVFYYYQQQGKFDAAQKTVTDFRLHKEAAKSDWPAQDLYVCARLLEDIHAYPESARYYFALYNSKGVADAQDRALVGLTNLLLTAPESSIQFGSGELSLYRDIATMDDGPGYLNGILSLILNTTVPATRFSEEQQRAIPYFHRSRAAQLLALLDANFPNSSRRSELHARLLDFYAGTGEKEAVIRGGREFLGAFPRAPQRTDIALLMADAYARSGKTQEEFAIYDSVLQELAAQAQRVPLGKNLAALEGSAVDATGVFEDQADSAESESAAREVSLARSGGEALHLSQAAATTAAGARSPEYSSVLERYLARLVQSKEIPAALAVLRREIDRNPDDPGLYERLAVFLQQNRLGAEQEEVYRRAMQRFPDHSWYDKLARFYLRQERNAEFEILTQEAVKTFSGTALERYFATVGYGGSPAMYLRLNQFAHKRFPHNPVFVRNLLGAYHNSHTYDDAAWQALLRQHWFEETDLRNLFFEFLSRNRQLESETNALRQDVPLATQNQWQELVRANPAAGEFLAQAGLWQSHFEDCAPVLNALAAEYPANFETASAASAVDRSLAWFDPSQTDAAVKIEGNLLQASPGNTQIMARIGDIYADRDLFRKAAPYWNRIPTVVPGQPGGYLEAASIYWDYFDFDMALRVLTEGRQNLGDDNLYSYEAGAIYENRRDYPHAVSEYIKGALAGGANSSADLRLLNLARRPKLRDLIDHETAKLVASPNPPMPAVYLRVRALEAQDRKPEMETFLDAVAGSTASIQTAEELESLAEQKSLERARQHALERQAALTIDPVNRLRLRYRLVLLYENHNDLQAAQRQTEALYRENPKLLGVVRSTVDFYWRAKSYPQAITVLLQASRDSYPDLGKQFIFEAARKSTEARQYQQARELLTQLLVSSPYDGQYLAAMADTYAQSGDDQGLRQFYLDQITLLRTAKIPSDERKTRIATLRRGLIPALHRMKDDAGVIDQYIELINNFPEDSSLVIEAALYALRHQRQQPLADFYTKTASQSPRDYRWPMVLAQIQTTLEKYPAAIESYGMAIAIRPDRVDLQAARAGLEERLMRFDDAAADYERIYQLAFKDPKWMEKVAEVRARQGRAESVVAALKTALIDGAPETSGKYFEVARRLESWGLLTQARTFAERGVASAGDDLLPTAAQHPGVRLYVRIMTHLRQQEKAYTTLQGALTDATSALPVIKEQIAKQGIAAITDKEWRERAQEIRERTAREGMRSALIEMGNTVAAYFTPEEKSAFASFAESKRAAMNLSDVDSFAIPLAQSAGLAELEARWRFELMMQEEASALQLANMQPLVDLQRRRLKFADLASQLEQLAQHDVPGQRYSIWIAAADAYRSASDPDNELRVLAAIPPAYIGGDAQQRLFQLMLARRPQALVQRAANWDTWGQQAADYIVANGDAGLVHALVSSRGRARPPVWSRSYDALAGLYFAEPTADVNEAFLAALGDNTIAERMAKPIDRGQQLAGNIWFYYGSRYGEYLSVTRQSDPEDFIPAVLEQSPASFSGYLSVADYYLDKGDTAQAIADYRRALELAPGRADLHDRLAGAFVRQNARAEAITEWKQALTILLQQVNSSRVPENFWTDFAHICDHLRAHRMFADLKPDTDALLRAYLRHNGNYRSNPPLQSAYVALGNPTAATLWLLELTSAAHDPAAVLADVIEAPWIPPAQRAPLYQRVLQLKQEAVSNLQGLEKDAAEQNLRSWQVRWVKYLVLTMQYASAGETISSLPKEVREAEAPALVPLELQVAARLGNLDLAIDRYRAAPESAPSSEILRDASRRLLDSGDRASARKVLEFAFSRELDDHQLVAANFLGLAEIRLAAGDTPAAIELLRRLVAVVGNPFENLDPASALLEKMGHNADAVEFLQALVQSAPWDAANRLRLAKAELASGKNEGPAQDTVASIASNPDVPYAVRTQAALSLASIQFPPLHPAVECGSKELSLLASRRVISALAADQPFLYSARLRAALGVADLRGKVQLLGNALADTPLRDDARVPLFLALAAARSDEFARGVIEPLLTRSSRNRFTRVGFAEEDSVTPGRGGEEDDAHSASLPSSLRVDTAQPSQVSLVLAEVLIRTDRMDEALPYLQNARRLEETPARRQQIGARLAAVRLQLRRRRLNQARQPILHEALEQDRLVRPRLLARTEPSAHAVTKGGVKP